MKIEEEREDANNNIRGKVTANHMYSPTCKLKKQEIIAEKERKPLETLIQIEEVIAYFSMNIKNYKTKLVLQIYRYIDQKMVSKSCV